MNKRLVTILATMVLTLILAMGASANTIQRVNVGYMNMNLTCVDVHSGNILGDSEFDASNHFFYLENSNLFGIGAVENLYWGIKTAGAINNTKSATDKNLSAMIASASIAAMIEYNYAAFDNVTIGAGASVGLNVLDLTTRSYDPTGDIDNSAVYHSIWKPYIQLGAHVVVDYYFNPLLSVSLVGGYNYSIGITKWLDGFNIIEDDANAQKNINAFYVSLGLGIKF